MLGVKGLLAAFTSAPDCAAAQSGAIQAPNAARASAFLAVPISTPRRSDQLDPLTSPILAAAANSSAHVSIRFEVSGPVSSILCLPTRPQRGCSVASYLSVAQAWMTPRGPYVSR